MASLLPYSSTFLYYQLNFTVLISLCLLYAFLLPARIKFQFPICPTLMFQFLTIHLQEDSDTLYSVILALLYCPKKFFLFTFSFLPTFTGPAISNLHHFILQAFSTTPKRTDLPSFDSSVALSHNNPHLVIQSHYCFYFLGLCGNSYPRQLPISIVLYVQLLH